MGKQRNIISKDEALMLLSAHIRKPDLDGGTLLKLIALYSKLQGWDAETKKPADEPNMDQLVAAIEKKRKSGVQ